MANKLWNCRGIIGGVINDLDSISVDSLTDGDRALVDKSGLFHVYDYDESGTLPTSYPDVVRPNSYRTSGNWNNVIGVSEESVVEKINSFTAVANQYLYFINSEFDITVTLPYTDLNSGDTVKMLNVSTKHLTFAYNGVFLNLTFADYDVNTDGPVFVVARYFANGAWIITMEPPAV